ncbi:MAG: hypothetical protein AAFN78_01600 [Pseudomonadota bacterium]
MLRTRRTITAGLVALLLSTNSFAMGLDFEPVVGTISGTDTVVFQFDVTEAGTYTAILTDMESPAPFTLLGLGIASEATGLLFEETIGTGQLTLDFTVDPGRYLALVGGIADADVTIGTFGLEIRPNFVPIPGAAVLLSSGLLMAGGLARTRRRGASTAVPA